MAVQDLVHLNAFLNLCATLFLIGARIAIKNKNKKKHALFMVICFVISCLFLMSYLYYHYHSHAMTPYQGGGILKYIYYGILMTHIPLAGLVPIGAIVAFIYAYQKRWEKHKKWVKWIWPIWLYVSITGVIIYLMLYIF